MTLFAYLLDRNTKLIEFDCGIDNIDIYLYYPYRVYIQWLSNLKRDSQRLGHIWINHTKWYIDWSICLSVPSLYISALTLLKTDLRIFFTHPKSRLKDDFSSGQSGELIIYNSADHRSSRTSEVWTEWGSKFKHDPSTTRAIRLQF